MEGGWGWGVGRRLSSVGGGRAAPTFLRRQPASSKVRFEPKIKAPGALGSIFLCLFLDGFMALHVGTVAAMLFSGPARPWVKRPPPAGTVAPPVPRRRGPRSSPRAVRAGGRTNRRSQEAAAAAIMALIACFFCQAEISGAATIRLKPPKTSE